MQRGCPCRTVIVSGSAVDFGIVIPGVPKVSGIYCTLGQVGNGTRHGLKNGEDNQSADKFVTIGRGCESVFGTPVGMSVHWPGRVRNWVDPVEL